METRTWVTSLFELMFEEEFDVRSTVGAEDDEIEAAIEAHNAAFEVTSELELAYEVSS